MPFALGLLLIPVTVYLRRSMPETRGHDGAAKDSNEPESLRQYSRLMMMSTLVVLGVTALLAALTAVSGAASLVAMIALPEGRGKAV